MEACLKEKYARLKDSIAVFESAAVAFSGGVDSTLLLKAAYDVLGGKTIAFIGKSPFQIPSELTQALHTAENIGCKAVVVHFDMTTDDIFTANKTNRCYYCKKLIYTAFLKKAAQYNYSVLMDGTNLDDTFKDRPGAKAIKELNIKTPLKDAQLTKREIRRISKDLGLSTWDKFSASCLATRIQTGKQITLEDIAIVTEVENLLNQEGFLGSRLKIGKNCAIISLVQGDHVRFFTSKIRSQIEKHLKTKGFHQLFLDLSEREGILT